MAKIETVSENIWMGKCVHTSHWTTHALEAYFKARTFLLFSPVFGFWRHDMKRYDTQRYPVWPEGRKKPLKPKIKCYWANLRHLCLPNLTTNIKGEYINDQIQLQYLLECMYLARGSAHISVGKHVYRPEAQHTCCAANKYVQHSLFANKLQNVNLSEAMFCKHRWL